MTRRPNAQPAAAAPAPIATTIVRSIEPLNLDGWLADYARAIVEAKGATPPTSPASTEAA